MGIIGPELESQIRSSMPKNISEVSVDSSFWYPLARPSYGAEEVLEALESMMTFRTTMWDKTRRFENRFGEMLNSEAIMVNSGSSADLLMVFAQLTQSGGSLRPGDEVCVPAVTWPTHLWSVLMAGLKPVLIDIDPRTLNLSIDDLVRKSSPRTRCIFPVHLMGNPADLDAILSLAHDLGAVVLEDCCEALGAQWRGQPVGTFGDAGSFSFFFSHHMVTMEGGMITTKNPRHAERYRLLRAHGWSRNLRDPSKFLPVGEDFSLLDDRYTFVEWGLNVRPTELQAGFGLRQLDRLPDFDQSRATNFLFFTKLLEECGLTEQLAVPTVLDAAQPNWFALPLMIRGQSPHLRDDLVEFLKKRGVETRPIVAGNLARHPVRRRFPEVFDVPLPGADEVHAQGFYTGLYPFEMEDHLVRYVEFLSEFFRKEH
jgi:CDP-6-deoxy-D-xylo-4-hexulose-3-dehydrase